MLHRAEDTRFKNGYNKYADPKHYHDAPTVIPADVDKDINVLGKADKEGEE